MRPRSALLGGPVLALVLLAGCSSGATPTPTTTEPSASPAPATTSAAATSTTPVVGPRIVGRNVRVDLTTTPARQAVGLDGGQQRRVLYYRPRGAPALVQVVTDGGVFSSAAFQVSASTTPVGSPAPSPNDTAPAYLLILAHYDSAQGAIRALRSQAEALGIDPSDLRAHSRPDVPLRGVPGGGVAVVVQTGPDPDYGGYQVNYEFGAP